MKVQLITTPSRLNMPNYIVPTGILSLAAVLEQNGYEVNIIDQAKLRETHDDLIKRIIMFKPDLIGIGGIITAYSYISDLTMEIKKQFPVIPIVVGGQVVTSNFEACFYHMGVDYLISGYGEISLLKLLNYLKGELKIEEVPGLSYKKKNILYENKHREFYKDINQIPLPAYHLIDMEHYATINGTKNIKLDEWLKKRNKSATNYRFLTIMGALGCIAKCTFCIHEQEYVGLKYYSDDYLINHIKLLYDKWNIRVLGIGEEMFIANANRAKRISNLITTHFPDLYWRTATRASFITEELLDVLDSDSCNCYSVAFGFESGSNRVLRLMNKGTTRDDNIRAFKLLDKSKFLLGTCSFMVGNVGETNVSIKETISSIHHAKIYSAAVFCTTPYPGGRIWDWAVEKKIIKDVHDYLLEISGKDAAGNYNLKLNPYPVWILKAWRSLVRAALEQQNRKRNKNITLKQKIRSVQLAYFPKVNYFLTYYKLLTLIIDVYFVYYNFTRKFLKIAVNDKYSYSKDSKGVLLPKNIKIGKVPDNIYEK